MAAITWAPSTDYICLAIVLLAMCWDLLVLLRAGRQATISARVFWWSQRYPAIPFALGFLAGHWFG